jgi:DNA-directed RNA polymerase specialized sigma24 family protein
MSSSGSITVWLRQLNTGDESALGKLHHRYWPALVALARKKLKVTPALACHDEDVAQEAFWSFYRSLKAGRVPRLTHRHELLALLTHIVSCKAVNQIQHEVGVARRGGGRVRDEAALDGGDDSGPWGSLQELAAGNEHTPLEQALLKDCYRHYVDGLTEHLRDFAELYLAGCTHKEIAARKGCVERTVERKVALILEKWHAMAVDSVNEDGAPG